MPGPEIVVVEKSLHDLIHMRDFRPIRNSLQIPEKLRRDRLLTLPVMVAVILGCNLVLLSHQCVRPI
jgi:hypothetical protein